MYKYTQEYEHNQTSLQSVLHPQSQANRWQVHSHGAEDMQYLQLDASKSFGYALNDRFYTAKQRSTSGIKDLCIHPSTLLSVAIESIF